MPYIDLFYQKYKLCHFIHLLYPFLSLSGYFISVPFYFSINWGIHKVQYRKIINYNSDNSIFFFFSFLSFFNFIDETQKYDFYNLVEELKVHENLLLLTPANSSRLPPSKYWGAKLQSETGLIHLQNNTACIQPRMPKKNFFLFQKSRLGKFLLKINYKSSQTLFKF